MALKTHKFVADWYRPSECTMCSYKRSHPIHDHSEEWDKLWDAECIEDDRVQAKHERES